MPPRPVSDERGYTLPELLVVVLLVGILAALGLAVFLRQQQTGQDGSAKAAARDLVAMVERCNAQRNDYRRCDTASALGPTALSLGSRPGDVEVTDASADTYTVRAHSRSGNWFDVSRTPRRVEHACADAGRGGCHSDSSW